MKIRILITLKNGVLDTQGKAIENSLTKDLGFNSVSDVRQGRLIELKIADDQKDNIAQIVDDLCDKVLVNKVIEDYSFEIL
ncbi:MAG: phosphoribosylformylglycinamidine synthase subunit PurS [Rickettsiales bacterium]|nr:phosphoribosylformylglycinamidine synthase subunit PurS [Rickettsiales bacterium]